MKTESRMNANLPLFEPRDNKSVHTIIGVESTLAFRTEHSRPNNEDAIRGFKTSSRKCGSGEYVVA